jgi:quercetin dioxygenase-like cupin family protein
MTTPLDLDIPAPLGTMHRGEDQLPWVDLTDQVQIKVVHVNLNDGLWITHNRMAPGTRVQTHRHAGHVFAFTIGGSWHYLESADDVNHAGSYLFEPAGSTHTLAVPEDSDGPADVWFVIYGPLLNLDADGNVETVVDGAAMLAYYRQLCRLQGFDTPNVYVER